MEILFLIVVTVFILSKLYKVLGAVDDDANNAMEEKNKIANAMGFDNDDSSQQLDDFELKMSAFLQDKFKEFKRLDDEFSAKQFVDNAKKAFTIIVEAYSNNKLAVIKPLVAPKIYAAFSAEVKRNKTKKTMPTAEVIRHFNTEIVDAKLDGYDARISIIFHTEQKLGDKGEIVEMEDTWVFERNLMDDDPVWRLIST